MSDDLSRAGAPEAIENPDRNAWLKNTYFWIAAILAVLAVLGLIKGDDSIRDPGQRDEPNLWLLYLVGSVLMLVNGVISHRSWLAHRKLEE